MKKFIIKAKDVQDFVKGKEVLFASGTSKLFFIALEAGPNTDRYIIETPAGRTSFNRIGKAVHFFNMH